MSTGFHTIYLGFGANLGERHAMLRAVRERLAPAVVVTAWSSLYQTAPWGVTNQPPFLNAVCCARTTLAPMELLAFLKGLEDELGRLPSFRWGPRSIDIDILFYDALVLNLEHLSIPHPRLHERAFVLVPLQELAPKLRHPVLHQTVRELAALLPQSGIERASEQW